MAGGKKSRDGDAVGRRGFASRGAEVGGRIMFHKLEQQKSFHFLEKSSRMGYYKSTK
jgi:hypothetical protein